MKKKAAVFLVGTIVALSVLMPPAVVMTLDEINISPGMVTAAASESGTESVSVRGEQQTEDTGGSKSEQTEETPAAVSAGPETDETVEIPNYRGMSEDYAREALEDRGLIVQVRRGKTSGIGYGEVIETRPAAGTEVPVGSTVTLIINDPDGDEDAGEDEDEEEDDRPGWTASAKLGEASNYTGGAYRLVLEQTVDGEKVTTELESGDTLTFPHQMEITGAAGVRNGYVVLYEETDSGETVRAQWPVTFTGN